MCAGLFIAYLGGSLLLSRLSAEAAKIHYDSNLLWTNKLDWYSAPALLHPYSVFC